MLGCRSKFDAEQPRQVIGVDAEVIRNLPDGRQLCILIVHVEANLLCCRHLSGSGELDAEVTGEHGKHFVERGFCFKVAGASAALEPAHMQQQVSVFFYGQISEQIVFF